MSSIIADAVLKWASTLFNGNLYVNPLVIPEPLSRCNWGGKWEIQQFHWAQSIKLCCEGSFHVLLFLRLLNLFFFVYYSNLLLCVSFFLLQDPSKDPWVEAQNWIKKAWSNLPIGKEVHILRGKILIGFTWGGSGNNKPLDIAVQFHRFYFLATQCLRKNNCFDCHVFHHL